MRTLATDSTANQLVDYLASDGAGGEWTYYAELAKWESLCNLLGERHFIGKLARNLACRELADMRRAWASLRMQLRLTPAGIELAGERDREAFQPASWWCDSGTATRGCGMNGALGRGHRK
jgi:hypothetical protein